MRHLDELEDLYLAEQRVIEHRASGQSAVSLAELDGDQRRHNYPTDLCQQQKPKKQITDPREPPEREAIVFM